MKLNLSKLEILALQHLCKTSYTAGALAKELGMKKSFFSRVLKLLSEKGLALVERRGTEKRIRLSPASHAQSFRNLYNTRPNAKIKNWLSGRAMGLLIIMAGTDEGVSLETLLEEGECSRPTIYKTLKMLSGVGAASKNRENRRFLIRDNYVKKFANDYADGIQMVLQGRSGGFNTSIRVRKNVIVRTDAKEVPDFFCETGLSALADEGLEAILAGYSDYYFELGCRIRKLALEEKFVHAILLSTLQQHAADRILLKIFYTKNSKRMDARAIGKLAKKYDVGGEFGDIRGSVEDYRKIGGFV